MGEANAGNAATHRTRTRLWDAYAAVYDLGVTRLAPYRQLQDDVLGAARKEADRLQAGGRRGPLRLLDLCCGTGNHLARLLEGLGEVSATGVDLSPVIKVLKQLPAACFDLVVTCTSFYPQPRQAELLAQVRRVLRPGGALVLSDPLRGANLLTLLVEHLRVEGVMGLYVLPMLCASFACSLFVQADAAKTFCAPERTRALLEEAGLTTHHESRTYAGANYLLVARPA